MRPESFLDEDLQKDLSYCAKYLKAAHNRPDEEAFSRACKRVFKLRGCNLEDAKKVKRSLKDNTFKTFKDEIIKESLSFCIEYLNVTLEEMEPRYPDMLEKTLKEIIEVRGGK